MKKLIVTLTVIMAVLLSTVPIFADASPEINAVFDNNAVAISMQNVTASQSYEVTLQLSSTATSTSVQWGAELSSSYKKAVVSGNTVTIYIENSSNLLAENGTLSIGNLSYSGYKKADSITSASIKVVDGAFVATNYENVQVNASKTDNPQSSSSQANNSTTTSTSTSTASSSKTTSSSKASSSTSAKIDGIVVSENSASLTLPTGTTTVSFNDLTALFNLNKDIAVEIKTETATFTFEAGAMMLPQEATVYDFGVAIVTGVPNGFTIDENEDFMYAIAYKHSGPLPGTAKISLSLGADAANKTMKYYYCNEETKTLDFLCETTANASGVATVSQERCSTYVFTMAKSSEPQVEISSSSNSEVTTQTQSNTSFVWIIVLCVILALVLIAGVVILFVKRK